MNPAFLTALAALLIGLIVAVLVFAARRRRAHRARRQRLAATPLGEEDRGVLEKSLPLFHQIPQDHRARLEGFIHIFLDEKSFEGCGGLELTHEMRLLIAAQACLLLLNEAGNFYPDLHSILVYPDSFRQRSPEIFSSQRSERGERVLVGESWETGSV
ncbi:MAG: zinc-dependent peptidase, partial [Verrucomicrobiales bacterium]